MPATQFDPVDEAELLSLVDDEIKASVSFDNDTDKDQRETALQYHRGEMRDTPPVPDWSEVVSKDVAEVVDLVLPGIMRVFDAPDLAKFGPASQGDEQAAEQATEYLNFLWQGELDGYSVLYTAVHDALVVRNGIIKHYWDYTPQYTTQTLHNLDFEQYVRLTQDPEVTVLGAETREIAFEAIGEQVSIPVFDVRVRRVAVNGRLVVENIPPEDFGISSEAKTIPKGRCVWHRTVKTRSDLIKEGFDRDLVADIPSGVSESSTTQDRKEESSGILPHQGKGALEEIEVYEVYLLADMNGDGIAERIKVLTAGQSGGRKILEWEEWPEDEVPFTDLVALMVPHRWMGKSLADSVMDMQRIKTTLCRQLMDNFYTVNRPMQEVVEKLIISPSEILRPKPGQKVRVKEAGAIRNLEVPFIGDKALMGINYIDKVISRRTGVSESTAALDETALDPQTATAEQIQHDASYARVELMVRTMAKKGLKALFANLLRLIVKHQDRARMIRLRDEWVPFDPRPWNADMDVTVRVGQGTGSRERDLAMLTAISAEQDKVIERLGPDNPIVKPSQWIATRHKKVQAAGLDDPDQYFSPVTDEEFAQWQAQRQQSAPPDPRMQEAQAKIEVMRETAQAKQQTEREKLQAQLQLRREEFEAEMALQEREMMAEAELKGMQVLAGAGGPASTNIPAPWKN